MRPGRRTVADVEKELNKARAERDKWGSNPHTRRMEHYGKTCWAVALLEQELAELKLSG